MKIYHAVEESLWNKAQKDGVYAPPSLREEGFLHSSTADQLLPTANRKCKDQDGLFVLVIDTEKCTSKIMFELASNGEKYPHIYGPLNLDAVVNTIKLEKDKAGEFQISSK